MSDACRESISQLWVRGGGFRGSHAALLRDRFLKVIKTDDDAEKQEAREKLFGKMQDALPLSYEVYKPAFRRYKKSLDCLIKKEGVFTVNGRMIIGLGSENVLETGITLHHTYGVPYIPGTALKGLASHYCHRVLGAHNRIFDKLKQQELSDDERIYDALFGTSDDSGHIRFHDAWIDPESLKQKPLRKDIMTPHHGDYYSGTMIRNGDNGQGIPAAPTDFDKPNPVSFLSVTGNFYVAVSCDDVDPQKGPQWAEFAFEILEKALKEWGIGGKTNAGYGRMTLAGKPVGEPGGSVSKSPLYAKGTEIDVVRIEDFINKKGKARPCFQADDGFTGFLENGIIPASVIQGSTVRLKIHAVQDDPNMKYVFDYSAEPAEKPDATGGKRRFGKQ